MPKHDPFMLCESEDCTTSGVIVARLEHDGFASSGYLCEKHRQEHIVDGMLKGEYRFRSSPSTAMVAAA